MPRLLEHLQISTVGANGEGWDCREGVPGGGNVPKNSERAATG